MDSVVSSKHKGTHSGRAKYQSSKSIMVLKAKSTSASVAIPREGDLETLAVGSGSVPVTGGPEECCHKGHCRRWLMGPQLILMMHVVLIPKLALLKNELWPKTIRGCRFATS